MFLRGPATLGPGSLSGAPWQPQPPRFDEQSGSEQLSGRAPRLLCDCTCQRGAQGQLPVKQAAPAGCRLQQLCCKQKQYSTSTTGRLNSSCSRLPSAFAGTLTPNPAGSRAPHPQPCRAFTRVRRCGRKGAVGGGRPAAAPRRAAPPPPHLPAKPAPLPNTAGQYEKDFLPKRLCNWEQPDAGKERVRGFGGGSAAPGRCRTGSRHARADEKGARLVGGVTPTTGRAAPPPASSQPPPPGHQRKQPLWHAAAPPPRGAHPLCRRRARPPAAGRAENWQRVLPGRRGGRAAALAERRDADPPRRAGGDARLQGCGGLWSRPRFLHARARLPPTASRPPNLTHRVVPTQTRANRHRHRLPPLEHRHHPHRGAAGLPRAAVHVTAGGRPLWSCSRARQQACGPIQVSGWGKGGGCATGASEQRVAPQEAKARRQALPPPIRVVKFLKWLKDTNEPRRGRQAGASPSLLGDVTPTYHFAHLQ